MELSNVDAARILFGFTATYHFLFVPVTIGLMAVIALFEGCALLSGRPELRQVARFLSWPFLINFVCGVLTGYPLRFQIETHWAGYARVVHDVVNSVFAFEAKVAPWMFMLVVAFAFGWRLRPVWHWLISTALAVVLIVQSCAILMINAWMQRPDGATFDRNTARIDGLADLIDNPLLAPKLLHTIGGAWVLGGIVTVSACAWFLRARRDVPAARAGLLAASAFTLFSLLLTGAAGHWSGERLVQHQPMKFAAIEALWHGDGRDAKLLLFAWPDPNAGTNRYELGIPGGLGWVVGGHDHPLRGLNELKDRTADAIRFELEAAPHLDGRLGFATLLGPDCCDTSPSDHDIDRAAQKAIPPVATVFWSFRAMLLAWGLMCIVVVLVLWRRPDADSPRGRGLLTACVWALPLPWIAIEAGWLVCEAGRQPWTVTGMLATRASVGVVTSAEAIEHLLLAGSLGAVLLLTHVKLHTAHLRRGLVLGRSRMWPIGRAVAAYFGRGRTRSV